VAFKLAWGLCQHVLGARKVSAELKLFLEEATSYVAIATVCDVHVNTVARDLRFGEAWLRRHLAAS